MQEDNTERGFWAVVHSTSGKKYIGRVDAIKKSEVIEDRTVMFRMLDTFELSTSMMPAPMPGGQVGMKHIVQPMPLDGCQDPATIYVTPAAISFFEDMSENDRNRHHGLLKQIKAQILTQRAEHAGIQLSGSLPQIGPNGRSS